MKTMDAAVRADEASSTRPRRRPPLGARVVVGLIGIGVALFSVALMLSDRAPGALDAMFGDRAQRLWDRIDASERANVLTSRGAPEPDTAVHVVIWASMVILIGLAIWTWRGLAVTAIGVFVVSVFIELAQGRYSSSRSVEMDDVTANAMGVGVGVVGTAVTFLVWSAASSLASNARR